ncbi:Gfo/Idh/MocA family oxidoreductase [Sphingobacterium sp. N143]|uniref:Gfo/Idh/MocA family protein n=1 Tax=Sphingobacterium sp. N143 TaxID=2746727 RepID=UPI0025773312|nr:Gfo/Idh/MocA family oxidoreductase [Sphingobacterium sp. N143]MDM1295728.1 Gfo/Idh/MocA family oxidoreductase [Sphingobacterium sp. N143]
MENTKINTGILSFGMSGRVFHAPFIQTNPHFNLVAVVERSTKSAHTLYPGIKSYDSIAEILADDSIELIIVNTPNHTHFQFASEALLAGKHVLIEKPAVDNSLQFNKLIEISNQSKKQVFFYQNRRFDSHFLDVKKIIDSGKLGKLTEVHFRFDRYKMELGQKYFKENNQFVSSGLTYDLGPHIIDQAISLFGKPLKFSKTTSINRPGSQVADFFHYHLRYPNDLNVFLTGSLAVADPLPAFVLHGTKGSFIKTMADVQEQQLIDGMLPTDPMYGIEPNECMGKLVTVDESNERQTTYVDAHQGNYNLLFDAIYESLRNKVDYPITADQVKWQIQMLEAEDTL